MITAAKKGFSLIELLVVVSIIGILTTLVYANLNAARERARDAVRKSDLKNIQTALRMFYNDANKFPQNNGEYYIVGCGTKTSVSMCEWGGPWTYNGQTYMSILPVDPSGTTSYYHYISTGDDDFTLYACLENKSDDKGTDTTDLTWCSSGRVFILRP